MICCSFRLFRQFFFLCLLLFSFSVFFQICFYSHISFSFILSILDITLRISVLLHAIFRAVERNHISKLQFLIFICLCKMQIFVLEAHELEKKLFFTCFCFVFNPISVARGSICVIRAFIVLNFCRLFNSELCNEHSNTKAQLHQIKLVLLNQNFANEAHVRCLREPFL